MTSSGDDAMSIAPNGTSGLEDHSEELESRSESEAQGRFYRAMADLGAPVHDYHTLLEGIAEAVAKVVFDFCAVHLVSDDGRRIELEAAFHPNDAIEEEIRQMYASTPQAVDEGVLGHVLSSRESYFQPYWSRLRQRHDTKPEYRSTASKLRIHSLMAAPLITSEGEVVGTLTVGRHNTRNAYDETDLALLEWIASHAASKVETARLTRDLRRINAELDAAVKARDRFISVASHELRTPMTVARLLVDRLEHELSLYDVSDNLYSIVTPKLRNIDGQIGRLTELIDRMLDVARLCEDRLMLECREFDMCNAVDETVEGLSPILEEAGCEIAVQLDAPQRGVWDRARVVQIVTNLLANVEKYAAPCQVEIEVRSRDGKVVLSVADDGPGIPPADQRRIFERFESVVGRDKSKGGMGLGLWIVRRYAESMGGAISVASEPGRGARFVLVLPRYVDAER